MKVTLFFACIFLMSTVPAFSRVHIIDGRNAPKGSHPWLLTLLFHIPNSDYKQLCGANLIRVSKSSNSSDLALTAAHCVFPACKNNKMSKYIKVTASNYHFYKKDDHEIIVRVVDSMCHPEYFRNLNDIALIRLAEPIEFTDTIQPIDLPRRGDRVAAGTRCKVAGWGMTEIGSEKAAPILQEADAKIIVDSHCKGEDLETKICSVVRDGEGRPFEGDSGGALVCMEDGKPIMHGLASYMRAAFWPRIINVYTRVSSYIDWIEEEIEKERN